MRRGAEITRRAKDARTVMEQNREEGEVIFERLLVESKHDAIVYFERAFAWQYLDELELAYRDFQTAAERFPMAKWKKIARDHASRIAGQLGPAKTSSTSNETWTNNLPQNLLHEIQKTFNDLLEEPITGCLRARHLLGELVRLFEPGNPRQAPASMSTLFEQIDHLKESLPKTLISQMHYIRVCGNEVAQGGAVTPQDAKVVLEALKAVLCMLPFHKRKKSQ